MRKLTRLELQIMRLVWAHGASSIREIQEGFPSKKRPAYTTVQTTVYRLEQLGALRNTKRIGKANIFEAAISQEDAHRRLIDDLLSLLGGDGKPIMAHLVRTRKVTMDDIKEAEEELRKADKKEKTK
jgi:predicted transcriptional regulator